MSTDDDGSGFATGEEDVLRQRAEQLARPTGAAAPRHAALEALDFSVAGQRCLLELAWLREVRPLRDLLPVPLGDGSLLGLVQVHGRLLVVLDVARLLGDSGSREPAGRLLVLGRGAAECAIAADEIHGLHLLSQQQAERRSQPLEGMRPDIVRGVSAEGYLLLDGARLLSIHRGSANAGRNQPHEQ